MYLFQRMIQMYNSKWLFGSPPVTCLCDLLSSAPPLTNTLIYWKHLSVHAPPASVTFKSFCPNDIFLWRHIRAWHHTLTSHDVLTSHHGQGFASCPSNQRKISRIARKSYFLTWWPMTLTIELDLGMVQVDLDVKFLVRTSDGSDSMTSTSDAGGKK